MIKKSSIRIKRIYMLFLASLLFTAPLSTHPQEQEHDSLEYEVSVKALQVPFVAVDAKGNPVYDLEYDELEVYVNKKKVTILYLYSLSFADAQAEPTVKKSAKEKTGTPPPEGSKLNETGLKKTVQKKPIRLKFLIADSLFNTSMGMKNGKMLARKLIENAAPEDRFILLEIRLGGLKYIAGPEPASPEFLKHLKKLLRHPQKINSWQHMKYDGLRDLMKEGNMHAQRNAVLMYLDSFSQFKNALKTIEDPKVTYLLSGGFRAHIHNDYITGENGPIYIPNTSAYPFRKYKEEMINEVYNGGSVLKRVDVAGLLPHQIDGVSQWLTRATAAYYELFFNPGSLEGKDMKIKIKCKRKDVRIDAVGHKEKEKPYQKMNRVQRKLFAVSVVTGRSYSGMIGRVKRENFTVLQKDRTGGETRIAVEVPIPERWWGRQLDIYALRFDEKFQDVDTAVRSDVAKEKEVIALPTKKSKKLLYFVIVEPETASCIYNKVL